MDGLNLNNELFHQVLEVFGHHDARGQEDMLVNLQYLVAIAGYFAADYPGPEQEREELLAHLNSLMRHVCDDRIAKRRPNVAVNNNTAATAPQGRSVPTDDPAVGIWQPD